MLIRTLRGVRGLLPRPGPPPAEARLSPRVRISYPQRMNLMLFEPGELDAPLPRGDVRARHILEVLRLGVGARIEAGVIDGVSGVATILEIGAQAVRLSFAPGSEPPPLPHVTLVIGLPRPPTARDVLRDATTLGVRGIHFVTPQLGDPNYATSSLWKTGEWRRQLIQGAGQARCTRLPEVTWGRRLGAVLAGSAATERLALHTDEAATPLAAWRRSPVGASVLVAVGPERGWGPRDLLALREGGCTFWHLGARVLRVELAVAAALTLIHAEFARSTSP